MPAAFPLAVHLGPVLLVVGGVWVGMSILMQWGAARAGRLARRKPPPCFSADGPGPARERVRLAFLGDLQRGVFGVPRALARFLPGSGVDVLVSSGDFVSHGEGPYYGVLLAAFERAGVDTPIRVVPGNHDLWPRRSKDDRIGGAHFERAFGARSFAERIGPVLVVGLDNGSVWTVEEQLPWLEATLAEHSGTPWICVCHRPPRAFGHAGDPPPVDQAELVALLEAHPPALVISGHMHRRHEQTVNGVHYVVNAHGGDVHGLGVARGGFELLKVDAGPSGVELTWHDLRRRADWRTGLDQLAVRFWSDRRKPWGAVLAAPAGLVLRALGRYEPVVRHPVERRLPEREVLRQRRQQPAARD